MRPTWLFEADVFGQTADPLKAEVRRQGMACHVTRQDPPTRVVVAEPRPVGREWRLVIADGVVVGAGQYMADGDIETDPGCPAAVRAFADAALAAVAWRPDEVFMFDVCESDGELYL